MMKQPRAKQLTALTFSFFLAGAPASFAQSTTNQQTPSSTDAAAQTQTTNTQSTHTSTSNASASARTTLVSGQKMKIKGIVTDRNADSFTVQDETGASTVIKLADNASVKQKGGFWSRGKTFAATSIMRGLFLEAEGRGDESGQLVANKVSFSDTDMRTARSLQSRVDPVESRVGGAEGKIGQVEQNAQRLSGQLDELAAVANTARGGARAAQEAADAAVAGVNATNERIASLDDYEAKSTATVNFKAGSAVLSADAKTKLDGVAQQALAAKGYMVEVSGFASTDGSLDLNRRLSERRAEQVIRYLVENHNIPLRRIITPFGYGEAQQIADNTTREGREQNRRVEVKVLVNRGLTQEAPKVSAAVNTPASQNN